MSDYWAAVLSGEDPGLKTSQRNFRRMPAPPRCKLCQAPFAGPFRPVLRVLGFNRWKLNQQLCRKCITSLDKHNGGAEISVSLLYADIRGSTALAETMQPREFTRTLDRFYAVVTRRIDQEQGAIDHMAGDGVMAFWIPGFVGSDHPTRAVAAGRHIVADLLDDAALDIAAGVAVHTGIAYVGVVGDVGSRDFTVLGDVANTVARLASSASHGELIMSDAIAEASGVDTTPLTRRVLDLKGKAEPFPVWVVTPSTAPLSS